MKIPFGKYKNRDVKVLVDDLGYAKWILEQDWVSQKYPELFEAIKNLSKDTSSNLAEKSLKAEKNILLSIALYTSH